MQPIDLKIIQTIAEKAYDGKELEDGTPLHNHCVELSNVFARMSCYELASVALLHEVFPLTELTEKDMVDMCLTRPVFEGMRILRQRDNESWVDYIHRVNQDDVCRYVKAMDLVSHPINTDKEMHEARIGIMILTGWPTREFMEDKFYDLLETPKTLRGYGPEFEDEGDANG